MFHIFLYFHFSLGAFGEEAEVLRKAGPVKGLLDCYEIFLHMCRYIKQKYF